MAQSALPTTVDVRAMAPRERHTPILPTLRALAPAPAMQPLNDLRNPS